MKPAVSREMEMHTSRAARMGKLSFERGMLALTTCNIYEVGIDDFGGLFNPHFSFGFSVEYFQAFEY